MIKHRATAISCVFVACMLAAAACFGQENPQSETDEQRQALLRQSLAYMQEFELRRIDGEREAFELIQPPLLVFADPTRANEKGTFWAWGKTGRPVAFLELYQTVGLEGRWVHAVSLTAAHRAVLKSDQATWQPEKTQIEPKLVPGASSPGKREPVRLRQMKEIARRFTAHEFWDPDNSRFELRLLEQPIRRYRDAGQKVHDGAAFALSNGTNPEVILLIEALGDTLEESRWHYSLARLGSAEMHAEIHGNEVWTCAVAGAGRVGLPTDPYWAFVTIATPDE